MVVVGRGRTVVVVVGRGLMGTACARHLAEAGCEVVLVGPDEPVDRASHEVISVKAFAKDGSRYTFQLTSFTPNQQFASDYFTFNANKFPGYYVEDLRE